MPVSLQEAVARRTELAARELISAARKVPTDRLSWQPMGDARTVLDIVQECGRVNDRWSGIIQTGVFEFWTEERIKQVVGETPDIDSAIAYLERATEKYVVHVRAIPDSMLDQNLAAPWITQPIADWLMHALAHLSYHAGQINYIQTLYGDWSFGD